MSGKTLGQRGCVTLVLSVLLYAMGGISPYGADGWFMESLVESHAFPVYYRSILTVWIHKLFYLLFQIWEGGAWNAIACSSAFAGAIAIQVLWAIRRHWLFMLINLASGSFLVFMGHVENYAWVNLFLLLTFWSALGWLQGRQRAWPIVTFYLLACVAHMLALFYLPAMIYLFYKNRTWNPYELLAPVLGFSILMIILPLTTNVLGTDNGLERLVPWFRKWAPNHHFTFWSWDHMKMLLFFHHRAAFLGIPFEIPLLIVLRKRIDHLYLRFLLMHVICGFVWTTAWHPDWGQNDWDLFSQFGIPLHVLLGLILTKERNNG